MQLFYIQCVLYNAIILHPVCSLALPGYNVLYNAGSTGLQQQDRANQDVRGVAVALDTITLLPNWPEIAKISFIFIFLLFWWTHIEALALDTTQVPPFQPEIASQVRKIQYVVFISKMILSTRSLQRCNQLYHLFKLDYSVVFLPPLHTWHNINACAAFKFFFLLPLIEITGTQTYIHKFLFFLLCWSGKSRIGQFLYL